MAFTLFDFLACSIAVFSVATNAVQFFVFRRRRPKAAPSIEARDLIHDLTQRGQAIVRIQVIDASQLLLRSPRG